MQCTESEDSFEVALPETLSESLDNEVEAYYDELMAWNQTLFEQEAGFGGDHFDAAGVVVNLADGRAVYADVPSALLSKIMSALSPEELGELVNAIVDAVENPDPRGLCQRSHDLS